MYTNAAEQLPFILQLLQVNNSHTAVIPNITLLSLQVSVSLANTWIN